MDKDNEFGKLSVSGTKRAVWCSKEQKLIKILDFAQIENNITVVKITNTPKDREEMARAFIAKSVYNMQTTRDF